jgi:hypothetical protein
MPNHEIGISEFIAWCMSSGLPLPRPIAWMRAIVEQLEAGQPLVLMTSRQHYKPPLIPGYRYICPREALEEKVREAEQSALSLVEVSTTGSSVVFDVETRCPPPFPITHQELIVLCPECNRPVYRLIGWYPEGAVSATAVRCDSCVGGDERDLRDA